VLRSGSNTRIPLILGIIGVVELVEYLNKGHHGAVIYVALLGSLVIAAVFGAIRAATTHVWLEGGQAWRQGNWVTAVTLAIQALILNARAQRIDGGGASPHDTAARTSFSSLPTLLTFSVTARQQPSDGGEGGERDRRAHAAPRLTSDMAAACWAGSSVSSCRTW
jgi:hypothetical protein